MNRIQQGLVWLSRIDKCRGFGIQSPTDYAFVRYVVNEHWPYYAYETLKANSWLERKLGRLYLRLANWRQPSAMLPDAYAAWWKSGCKRMRMVSQLQRVELAHVEIDDTAGLETLFPLCDESSVIVVEGLWRNRQRWHHIEHDAHVGTTFDLYYCGIVLFDKNRYHHHYKINF